MKAEIVDPNDLPKNVTVNLIRKASSTAVLEKDPSAAEHVASLMAHSSKTQAKHYNIRNRNESAKKGSKFIREHFYGSPNRKSWTPDESSIIQDVVKEGVALTPKRLKERLPNIEATPRKLYDKARREAIKISVGDEVSADAISSFLLDFT